MSSDPNKKSARTFQCRDVLWETFEQMARELECSVDYLINEAMKQYARQRSYGSRTPFPAGGGSRDGGSFPPPPSVPVPRTGPPPPVRSPGMGGMGRSPLPVPPPARPGMGPGVGMSGPSMGGGLPAPPPRSQGQGALGLPPVPPRSVPPIPPRSVPPPIPRNQAAPPPIQHHNGYDAPVAPSNAALSLVYNGERTMVQKDRFVIGRGKQSSDLTLKDPNVSRQHAMVEFQNGLYFMVDMGSTNGIEFNGQRIARKQINEGDVFRICDHDILFTYR